MKRFVLCLALLAGFAVRADAATTWYVSNANSHGYGLGNDSTGNGTLATPYLTVNKVMTVASAGDTCNINPSGTAYREDSSTHGLNVLPSAIVIQTDPSLVGGNGKVTIRGNGSTSTTVINLNTGTGALVFNDLVIDGESLTIHGVTPHTQTGAGMQFNRCQWVGISSGKNAIAGPSGTGNVATLVKCSCGSDVVNFFGSGDYGGSGGISIQGGTFAPSQSMTASTFPGTNALNLTCTLSSDLQRPAISGCASGAFQLKGTGATVFDADHTDFSANWSDVTCSAATPMTALTSLLYHDNTSSGTYTQCSVFLNNCTSSNVQIYNNNCTNTIGLVNLLAELTTNVLCHDNAVALSSNSPQQGIVVAAGTGCKSYNNVVNVTGNNTSILGVVFGSNGLLTDSSNSSSSGTQRLGDLTADTFLDQKFTTSALTASGRASWFGGCLVQLAATGSPTGTITAKLYTDSAGAPNTLLETSSTTVACASVTGSNQAFYFEFHTQQLAAATAYHLVFTGVSISASNYVSFEKNTTVTGGSLSTSADGSSWTNDSTHALLYVAYSYFGSMTDCQAYANTVTSNSAGSNLVHGVLIGATGGGSAYQNLILGTSLGVVSKDTYGVVIYSNFMYSALSSQGLGFIKGAHNCSIIQNTIIQAAGGTASCIEVVQDNNLGVNSNPTGSIVENNILIYGAVGSGSNYIYQLNSNPAGTYPSATINNNIIWGRDAFVIIERNRATTFAQWNALGFDTAGLNADPVLTNEVNPAVATDFKLTSTSSVAVGKGTNLVSSAGYDYFGNYFHVSATVGGHSIATNELLTRAAPGSAVDAMIVRADGFFYNKTTSAFEAYKTANLSSYARPMTQVGTASGVYVANMVYSLPLGDYKIKYSIRAGASPAESDTQITDAFSRTLVSWNATAATINLTASTDSSGRATLTPAEHTSISTTDLPSALNAQGLSTARAGKLDQLDAAISSRPTIAQLLANPSNPISTDPSGRVTLTPTGLPQIAGSVASSPSVLGFNAADGSGLSSTDQMYRGMFVAFTSGNLNSVPRKVIGYIGATRTFIFAAPLAQAPAINDTFVLIGGTQ